MSGHSKWANIKHRKAQQDAKKGKIYTKLIKEIMVAAKQGGGDPDANPRLRIAIQNAKANNMPSDTIKRAIQKGTGQVAESNLEEAIYEGYAAGGIAILIEALTDNKNRTVGEMRHIFSRYGGTLAKAGEVAWMFTKKGFIQIPKDSIDEEKLFNLVIDLGVEDITAEDKYWEIYCFPSSFEKILNTLKENNVPIHASELAMLPQSYIQLNAQQAQKVINLVEALDDHDDVQKVWTNLDIPDEEMSRLAG